MDTHYDACHAYDAFAPGYDDFTHRYLSAQWTDTLVQRAQRQRSLTGGRLLDVGCGTGKSFIPMLGRGWEVVGCDISSAMLAQARAKVGKSAVLMRADARNLPPLGLFDLVWALDDTINYLLNTADLTAALASMAKALKPDGVLLFDVNTMLTYKTFFCTEAVVEHNDHHFVWTGRETADAVGPGSICRATLAALDGSIPTHTHTQRHFTDEQVQSALDAAGLRCWERVGDAEGVLGDKVDEAMHSKAIYITGLSPQGL